MRNKYVSSKWKHRLAAACAMAVVLGGSQLNAETAMAATPGTYAGYTVEQKNDITILPIGQAKFLAGQKLDFCIEVKNAKADDINVTIDGKSAEKYFNKKAVRTANGTAASYRINDVSFNKAGKVAVKATAKGQEKSVTYTVTDAVAEQKAKNVILMVGDGMSLQARQMARILSKGIAEGRYHDLLEMEKMPQMALITTSGYDSIVTDSANSASAYATGQKGVVNSMGVYADSTKDPLDDPKVENIIELVKRNKNMATGLVTTASVTDATPAAMLAHTRRRAEQNYIAATMLDSCHRPDVILGGGQRYFKPQSTAGSKRQDNRNLIAEFEKLGYAYSNDKDSLEKTSKSATKLLGLYTPNHMNVYLDREVLRDNSVLGKYNNQPGLVEMTDKAINALSQNKNGFFLMVEGACIDKQLHAMDWQRATYDTIEFDQAIAHAKAFADKNKDTLIIVLADHAHGASITGTYTEKDGKTGREAVRTYAAGGFPTFEDRDGDGFPDNPDVDVTLAIQYANHPDNNMNYKFIKKPTNPTVVKDGIAKANPAKQGFFEAGNIPAKEDSEVHAADDIVLNAMGPGSDYFHGVMDNTEVFFGMMRALGIK